MIDILSYLNTQNILDTPKRVLDSGSGIGKFMLAMAITGLFMIVDGVELLPDLNANAVALADQAKQLSLQPITLVLYSLFVVILLYKISVNMI